MTDPADPAPEDRPVPPPRMTEHPPARPEGGRLRHGLHRAVDPLGLEARIEVLESELFEARQLSLRVAELTDLVAELVVPLAREDPERARALLDRYQGEIGS